MTTIITRLYPDAPGAQAAYDALVENGFVSDDLDMIGSYGDAAERMQQAGVGVKARDLYSGALDEGKVLLVLRARFGSAVNALETRDDFPSIDVGPVDQQVYIAPANAYPGSVLTNHPLFMSNPNSVMSGARMFGKDPILRGPRKISAMKGGGYMSKMFWPMKLLSESKARTSAIKGGFLFSSMIGMPTVIRGRRSS
jgi:hypothetical protein